MNHHPIYPHSLLSVSSIFPLGSGEDLLHKCELCSILAPSLTAAIDVLDNGVGVALAQTREVVSEQLQGDNLAKLSDSHWALMGNGIYESTMVYESGHLVNDMVYNSTPESYQLDISQLVPIIDVLFPLVG